MRTDEEEAAEHALILGSYLAWVTMQHRQAEAAIANRQHAIQQAREYGASWEELGASLGMSRQMAHKRFGHGRLHDP